MLFMQYFILISLSCFALNCVSTLSTYHNRIIRQTDVSYGSPAYRYCECGRKNIFLPSTRILGGSEVLENEFPWMAGIININTSRVICGASIISDRYVISAAHCVQNGFNKADMKVSLGNHYSCGWNAQTVIFSVEAIFQHPFYNKETNLADIMLVKLIMKISFNKYVRPICLPTSGYDVVSLYAEHSVSVLGWGLSEQDALLHGDCALRTVDIILYSRANCPTTIPTLICAGYKLAARGPCSGDSGGPLQIVDAYSKYVLIGISSSGLICADVNHPEYFTDVARMIPWILKVITYDSMYCWH